MRWIRALAGCLAIVTAQGRAAVFYVDDDAPLGGNGQSWPTAFTYLQDALAAAQAGDEIRVAAGRYTPDLDEGGVVKPLDRRATFALPADVRLLGGFAGRSAPEPDARDIGAHATTLSGDLKANDQPNFGNRTDNAFHVVTVGDVWRDTLLSGFTIRSGYAQGVNMPQNSGAGLLILRGGPTVEWCTFQDNSCQSNYRTGGAAIMVDGGLPVIRDCVFRENRLTAAGTIFAASGGAAVRCLESDPYFYRCLFVGNRAEAEGEPPQAFGGALATTGGTLRVYDCVFRENYSAGSAGALSVTQDYLQMTGCRFEQNEAALRGGGAAEIRFTGIEIKDCQFLENRSVFGGGLHLEGCRGDVIACQLAGNAATTDAGGAFIHAEAEDRLVLDYCTVAGNRAPLGGGILASDMQSMLISRTTLTGNEAQLGGGLYVRGVTRARMFSSTVTGNLADTGGALYVTDGARVEWVNARLVGNIVAERGGGAFVESGQVWLDHSLVWAQSANQGGGGLATDLAGALQVSNTIVRENSPDQIEPGAGTVAVRYSNVAGGWAGPGVLDADPRFTPSPHGSWTADATYDLQAYQILLHDSQANWLPGALAGQLVQLDAGHPRHAPVVANTETTLTVWADWATIEAGAASITAGTPYVVRDFRLAADSPCIDAGDNLDPIRDPLDYDFDGCATDPQPTDAIGHNRYYDDPATPDTGRGMSPLTDMGAYEYGADFEYATSLCPADVNCDGRVDFNDINPMILALTNPTKYVQTYPDCPLLNADTDNNGQVDVQDATLFVRLIVLP